MTTIRTLALAAMAAVAAILAAPAAAQDGPLRIEITEGVVEPLPFALPRFVAESPGAEEMAEQITQVIADDLTGTGLFRRIPPDAFVSEVTEFTSNVTYANWKAINAQALITGAVSMSGDEVTVKFRLFDVFSEAPLGEGLQMRGSEESWRRLGHKVADAVYSRITGESGYFDSRVVFVSEQGPKDQREKRLAVMDYDGADVQYLTDGGSLVLAPRFSPGGDRVLYTSYESGFPQIYQMDVGAVRPERLPVPAESMTFSPRYAPDGETIVFSASINGNTDIYRLRPGASEPEQLTDAPSIETAPSYGPEGDRIVFESDRSGTPQLYVMPANGGEARRISFGQGRYGTPVWSPRGDLIAFTKQNQGRFHIGVMRTDGSEERLLTASFLDEGPTWAPNGRVLMFTRESSGAGGSSSLYSVDVSGRNLSLVDTPGAASDPAWSPLLP